MRRGVSVQGNHLSMKASTSECRMGVQFDLERGVGVGRERKGGVRGGR